MIKKPIIGVTLDIEKAAKGGYSSEIDWYALRRNYIGAIVKAGGIALPLPHEISCINDYLKIIKGLVVTGGHFDIPPSMYGDESSVHETVTTKNNRTAFEYELVTKSLKKKLPFLGICGGEQLLNVVRGGTLIQHIPDEIDGAVTHEQKTTHDNPAHRIEVLKGTLLHKITRMKEMRVNSSHHQAVKDVGGGLVVSARAPDGVIEAIEDPHHPFCLGVEWHPEYEVSKGDSRIFSALVKACKI